MSIEDKLIQLAETKSLIKDAIAEKGVEIDSTTPFREYANKIQSIPTKKIVGYERNCYIKTSSDNYYNRSMFCDNIGVSGITSNRSNFVHNTNCEFIRTAPKWKFNIHFFTGDILTPDSGNYALACIGFLSSTDKSSDDHNGFLLSGSKGRTSSGLSFALSTDGVNWIGESWQGLGDITTNKEYTLSIEYDDVTGYRLLCYNITDDVVLKDLHLSLTAKLNWAGNKERAIYLGGTYDYPNQNSILNYKLDDCYLEQYDNNKELVAIHKFVEPIYK